MSWADIYEHQAMIWAMAATRSERPRGCSVKFCESASATYSDLAAEARLKDLNARENISGG